MQPHSKTIAAAVLELADILCQDNIAEADVLNAFLDWRNAWAYELKQIARKAKPPPSKLRLLEEEDNDGKA